MTTTITKNEFGEYLKNFEFKNLFITLGWNKDNTKLPPIEENNELFIFNIEAEKQGFSIISCHSENGAIPLSFLRKKIDNRIKALKHEHIIIFCSKETGEQVWLYNYRVGDKYKVAEIKYNINQDPERIYQRASGLIFELDEEDNITISDVKLRVNANFAVNSEKVTKKFYVEFSKQHTNFVKLIEGISDNTEKEWYASIMLNRLMFCYFIQKRSFFDNDKNYLKNKLELISSQNGNNQFYSFYKKFLTTLFHRGLAEPYSKRDKETQELLGNIPYLNGGIFEIHEIEQKYTDIQIPDKAFDNIFKLFDQYEWHLDTRECATGNEISPDVLGYIFEKYINDRAQMGAYYTQEDITEYISRSSIIPFLFNAVGKRLSNLFAENSEVSQMLRNSGDKYIFDAMKKGANETLPNYISEGLDTSKPNLLERRKRWNEPASEEFALPTEIWRETVSRLARYKEVKNKIENGEIASIEDFITYNLDICQFAQDLLDETQSPQLISNFYQELKKITVLDPTCGSGAFLFAALNILEPLYDSCLSRMEEFISSGIKIEDKQTRRLFEDELESLEKHENKQYFIYKSIILNNLYGVDIMKEATETAKLRLFLKLISTAEPQYHKDNLGIEPLPDIDFNIRCGNSLVGFATKDEIDIELNSNLDYYNLPAEVTEKIRRLSVETHKFRNMQMDYNIKVENLKAEKKILLEARNALNSILDKTLFKSQPQNKNTTPFHWYSEFYSIMDKDDGNGGFDVIIGNPPYVVYNPKSFSYKVFNYQTLDSSNLYAYILERSLRILNNLSNLSMIVPMSIITTQRTSSLRKYITKNTSTSWILNLAGDWHPGRLFDGVRSQFSIVTLVKSNNKKIFFSSSYLRWFNKERYKLFDLNWYQSNNYFSEDFSPKIGCNIEKSILNKINNNKTNLTNYNNSSGRGLYFYRNAGIAYYNIAINFNQEFSSGDGKKRSSTLKECYTKNQILADYLVALLNSSTFAWFYFLTSDCYHLTSNDLKNYKIDIPENQLEQMSILTQKLMASINKHSILKQTMYKTAGKVVYQEFYPRYSKAEIDEIDKVLAKHYGFTEEELDYIINYDIKYRMGNELDDNE